jgi:oligoribonuclease NrnB/cAMP/cGMP phosphodiesterase (DHH superfamily)
MDLSIINDTVVYYHKNCTDGFMARFVFEYFFRTYQPERKVEYIPINYGEDIKESTAEAVIVVDFTLNPKQESDLFKHKRKTLFTLDHHDSAKDQYGGYGTYRSIVDCCEEQCVKVTHLEEHKSGALLAFTCIDQYFYSKRIAEGHNEINQPPTTPNLVDAARAKEDALLNLMNERSRLDRLKMFVEAVSDRDLWNFHLKVTKFIHEYLNSVDFTYDNWYGLIFKPLTELNDDLNRIKQWLDCKESLTKGYASKHQIISFAGYDRVAIVNVPADLTSMTADFIYQDLTIDFVILYVVSVDRLYVSLRSNKRSNVNVKEIAGRYGGGGHINAAGISGLKPEDLLKIFNNTLPEIIIKEKEAQT